MQEGLVVELWGTRPIKLNFSPQGRIWSFAFRTLVTEFRNVCRGSVVNMCNVSNLCFEAGRRGGGAAKAMSVYRAPQAV